jgi:TLC domain
MLVSTHSVVPYVVSWDIKGNIYYPLFLIRCFVVNENDENKYQKQQPHDLSNRDHYWLRLFSYHPEAFRVSVFFVGYQVKNTCDTIIWNDGPEFIFHHIFSIFTAIGAMYPGTGHMYTIFFFGLSEISTAILCLLANFDDIHGVPGLGNAFPVVKAILGIIFAIHFIVFRCLLWPVFAYYFVRDVRTAMEYESIDVRCQQRHSWLRFFLISLSGISILQVAWLGQIFIQGKQEFEKMGFL